MPDGLGVPQVLMHADADRLANGRMTTAALTLIGVVAAAFLIAPRSSPALLLALALLAAAWVAGADLRRQAEGTGFTLFAALAFGLYLLLSVAWSADRSEAIGKVTLYFVFTGAVWIICSGARLMGERLLERLLTTLLIALAVGLFYLCFEELAGHWIKRELFRLVPAIRLPERHLIIANGEVEGVRAYASNRNMAALALMLWPMLLGAQSVLPPPWGRIAAWTMLATSALTIGLSEHDTSLVALPAGALVFLLARGWPRLSIGLLAAGWMTATLMVVPIVSAAYRDASLHFATWLPHTARQRVILWGYTAEQVAKRPWLGVGIAATKSLDLRRKDVEETPPGYVYPLRTGPHAHNIYLQTWYELGAIGALLLTWLGLAVLKAIAGLSRVLMPYALACFTTASIVGAFSWGMWQAWFMAAFGIAMALTAVSLAFAAHRRDLKLGAGTAPRPASRVAPASG
ncbi:MAG TPA: O-antigen ligase family protein [Hyphomicrobiaceae bacterium]|nr:O-antigen ligase family protein [Hyphomicrobiaceae bacterium]